MAFTEFYYTCSNYPYELCNPAYEIGVYSILFVPVSCLFYMKGYGMYVIGWLYTYNDTVSVLCTTV